MSTRRRDVLLVSVLSAVLAAPCLAAPPRGRGGNRDTWQQPDRVVKELDLKPGQSVADIGAGRGYFSFRLAKVVGPKGTVYATEISDKLVKGLQQAADRANAKNVKCVLSGHTETKLAEASVDAAMIVNVLHHVPKEQRPALVKDIVRAIKPGGYFYIIDWRVDAKVNFDKNRRIPKADLVKLGTDAGLVLDAEYYYLVHQVFLRLRKPTPAKGTSARGT